jgi:hypothetical protein
MSGATVVSYIAEQPKERRAALGGVGGVIGKAIAGGEEGIS